ncbi:MAG: hypothetical protein ABEH35_01665, partial [Haloarculaceae archaeon]
AGRRGARPTIDGHLAVPGESLHMYRRAFVVALCSALAGCAGVIRERNPLGPSGAGQREPARSGSFEIEGDEPFDGETVGSDGTTHELLVWNDGPAADIDLRVRGNESGPVFDESISFPEGGVFRVTIQSQDTYRVFVKRAKRREYWAPIDDSLFECDGARTMVRVPEFGRASYTSSRASCETPGEE